MKSDLAEVLSGESNQCGSGLDNSNLSIAEIRVQPLWTLNPLCDTIIR